MSYGLPDDWYIEPTGESRILDQQKVAKELLRLRKIEARVRLIAPQLEALVASVSAAPDAIGGTTTWWDIEENGAANAV